MNYLFEKDPNLVSLRSGSVRPQTLYHARQAFTELGEQQCDPSFALSWLSNIREGYRKSAKVHPQSKIKRRQFMQKLFHPASIFRHPNRYLRFYLERNGGSTIGDPTGSYFLAVPLEDPKMLADNFTWKLLHYYDNVPKTRMTKPKLGYGYVQLFVPPYVSLMKFEGQIKWRKFGGTQISGYLDENLIRQTITEEIKLYVKQFRSSMDTRYIDYLQSKIGYIP